MNYVTGSNASKGGKKPGFLGVKSRKQAVKQVRRALQGKVSSAPEKRRQKRPQDLPVIGTGRYSEVYEDHVSKVQAIGKRFVLKHPIMASGYEYDEKNYQHALERARREAESHTVASQIVPVARKAYTQMTFHNYNWREGFGVHHVFERVKPVKTFKGAEKAIPKILEMVKKTSGKRIVIDAHIGNVGTNRSGRLVVLDTDRTGMDNFKPREVLIMELINLKRSFRGDPEDRRLPIGERSTAPVKSEAELDRLDNRLDFLVGEKFGSKVLKEFKRKYKTGWDPYTERAKEEARKAKEERLKRPFRTAGDAQDMYSEAHQLTYDKVVLKNGKRQPFGGKANRAMREALVKEATMALEHPQTDPKAINHLKDVLGMLGRKKK